MGNNNHHLKKFIEETNYKNLEKLFLTIKKNKNENINNDELNNILNIIEKNKNSFNMINKEVLNNFIIKLKKIKEISINENVSFDKLKLYFNISEEKNRLYY
jgi:hypothetical protein